LFCRSGTCSLPSKLKYRKQSDGGRAMGIQKNTKQKRQKYNEINRAGTHSDLKQGPTHNHDPRREGSGAWCETENLPQWKGCRHELGDNRGFNGSAHLCVPQVCHGGLRVGVHLHASGLKSGRQEAKENRLREKDKANKINTSSGG
jgi:hypothetical protein